MSSVIIGDPAFTTLSTFGLNDSLIALTPSQADVAFGLSITQQNSTGEDWEGIEFEITGGSFVFAPSLTFGLAAASSFSSSEASLIFDTAGGNSAFYDLSISLLNSPVSIALRPIVPEPGVAVIGLIAPFLISRRRRASR